MIEHVEPVRRGPRRDSLVDDRDGLDVFGMGVPTMPVERLGLIHRADRPALEILALLRHLGAVVEPQRLVGVAVDRERLLLAHGLLARPSRAISSRRHLGRLLETRPVDGGAALQRESHRLSPLIIIPAKRELARARPSRPRAFASHACDLPAPGLQGQRSCAKAPLEGPVPPRPPSCAQAREAVVEGLRGRR